jgi:hypothetical protein
VPPMPSEPGPVAARAVPDGAFDLWLRRDLRRRYAAVAAEPIPLALLQLIDAASGNTATGPPGGGDRDAGLPKGHGRFEHRVRERAYFLWLEEGCPFGRAAAHWRKASALQAASDEGDGPGSGAGRIGHT